MARHARNLLRVRRMAREDLDRVAEIEARSFPTPWSRRMLEAELGREWSTALVAAQARPDRGDSVIGFALFWTVVDEVHVLDLAVDPSHLRRGVASLLVSAMLAEAREEGARLVSLEVRRSNVAAQILYRRHGFRPTGVRPRYYVEEGEDALIMELEL